MNRSSQYGQVRVTASYKQVLHLKLQETKTDNEQKADSIVHLALWRDRRTERERDRVIRGWGREVGDSGGGTERRERAGQKGKGGGTE